MNYLNKFTKNRLMDGMYVMINRAISIIVKKGRLTL